MKHYDLILVYTSHRRHENYLTIIRALCPYYSIGILRFAPKHKWSQTEQRFFDMCIEAGGQVVRGESACHSLIISRFGGKPGQGYYKDILEDMPQYIRFEHLFVHNDSIMSGVPTLKDICQKLGTPKILVQSRYYFGMYEPDTLKVVQRFNLEVIEVGSPFPKYPTFSEFSTDYIIAYPSHVSIKDNCEHFNLLAMITSVLFGIPKSAKVTIKPHNVKDTGNHLSQISLLQRIELPAVLIKSLARIIIFLKSDNHRFNLFSYFPKKFQKLFIGILNDYIFQRGENLLDSYPALGLEHFMPGVKQGLITGLSNSIFISLFHKVPVCLCTTLSKVSLTGTYRKMVKEFEMEEWKGFSTKGFRLVGQSFYDANLIQFLRNHIG